MFLYSLIKTRHTFFGDGVIIALLPFLGGWCHYFSALCPPGIFCAKRHLENPRMGWKRPPGFFLLPEDDPPGKASTQRIFLFSYLKISSPSLLGVEILQGLSWWRCRDDAQSCVLVLKKWREGKQPTNPWRKGLIREIWGKEWLGHFLLKWLQYHSSGCFTIQMNTQLECSKKGILEQK